MNPGYYLLGIYLGNVICLTALFMCHRLDGRAWPLLFPGLPGAALAFYSAWSAINA